MGVNAMTPWLLVALGGALGAAGRYGLSLLPWQGSFPLLTLLTNFLGAAAIGFLSGLFSRQLLGEGGRLFWQTGVCGGFTTFSTFSLETVSLLQGGKYLLGVAYALSSVLLCLAGVLLGQTLARLAVRAG